MKKTIRLGSFLLAFLLLVCTLPVTAWAASTSYDLSRALFRSAETQKHVVSYAKGEKAALTFTPPVHGGVYSELFCTQSEGRKRTQCARKFDFPGRKGAGRGVSIPSQLQGL